MTQDKQKIAYDYYQDNHRQAIIIAHGFYNSKDSVLLKKLAQSIYNDYDVFMFDWRGHGESSGEFSWMSRESEDFQAVLKYLEGRYEKLGMIAFSLGAGIAINVLAQRGGIDSLICVSPVSEFNKIDYSFWQLDLKGDLIYTLVSKEGRKGKGVRPGMFWLKKNKPLESVENIKAPILYIHGGKDWVIKPWHAKKLYEKTISQKKLVIIKDGPHAEYLIRDFPEIFVSQVKEWFKTTLNQEAEK